MPTDTSLKVVRRRHSINGLRVTQPPNIPAPSGTEGDLPPDAESHRVKEFSETSSIQREVERIRYISR
ncbi:MAG: hypothetical protein ACI89J_002301 [Hyphomicrobiaceae bacterium]|jgi:hypothetical protein